MAEDAVRNKIFEYKAVSALRGLQAPLLFQPMLWHSFREKQGDMACCRFTCEAREELQTIASDVEEIISRNGRVAWLLDQRLHLLFFVTLLSMQKGASWMSCCVYRVLRAFCLPYN